MSYVVPRGSRNMGSVYRPVCVAKGKRKLSIFWKRFSTWRRLAEKRGSRTNFMKELKSKIDYFSPRSSQYRGLAIFRIWYDVSFERRNFSKLRNIYKFQIFQHFLEFHMLLSQPAAQSSSFYQQVHTFWSHSVPMPLQQPQKCMPYVQQCTLQCCTMLSSVIIHI